MIRIAFLAGPIVGILLLSACASSGIAEQERLQSQDDILSESQLATAPEVDPDSTRFLGESGDRKYYVGTIASSSWTCLMAADPDTSMETACGPGFPISMSVPGQYSATLWLDAPVQVPKDVVQLGKHLWVVD